MLPQG
jgi:hypothetical protein